MENAIIGVIVALAILIILFLVFREIINWYWKINERISIAHKTNFLLEKISMQLGASDLDEITIEEITTGKKKKVKMDTWIEFKTKNPKASGYRTVNDDTTSEKK
jgi:preprotein translocase subunit SecF